MEQEDVSCVKPSRGPISEPTAEAPDRGEVSAKSEEAVVQAHVGMPAPDFEATAYVGGGFKTVKLSDYKGHWVVVCFYPGDFTFV